VARRVSFWCRGAFNALSGNIPSCSWLLRGLCPQRNESAGSAFGVLPAAAASRVQSDLCPADPIEVGFVLSPPPIGGSGSFCRRVRLRTFSRMRKPICRRLGDEKSHPGTTRCKAQSRRRPSHFDLIQQVSHRYATPLLNAYCEVEAHRNVRKGDPLPKAALPSRSRLPFHSRAR
jgi:hypothetical protein